MGNERVRAKPGLASRARNPNHLKRVGFQFLYSTNKQLSIPLFHKQTTFNFFVPHANNFRFLC